MACLFLKLTKGREHERESFVIKHRPYRVQLSPQVADLRYASPATVSRCGMVYVDPKNLGYNPYWEKWCNARGSDKEREELNRLFEKYVPSCIDLILEGIVEGKIGKKLKTIIPLTNLNMVSE